MILCGAMSSDIARADLLFDNLSSPLGFFNSGNQQVGDQIVLAGGVGANLTSFKFEYYGSNFLGGEQAQVILYKNDGATVSGYAAPGTQIWDSGLFSVPDTFNATLQTNALVTFDLTSEPGGGVNVPSEFTWSITFSGIGLNQSAGTILSSSGPTSGLDYNDYWLNTGSLVSPNWQLQTGTSYGIDFLAQFSGIPVPEPSICSLLGFGGLVGMLKFVSKRRSTRH